MHKHRLQIALYLRHSAQTVKCNYLVRNINSPPVRHISKYFLTEIHTVGTDPERLNYAWECWLIDNKKSNWPKSFFVWHWKLFLTLRQKLMTERERPFLPGWNIISYVLWIKCFLVWVDLYHLIKRLITHFTNVIVSGSFTVLQIMVHYQTWKKHLRTFQRVLILYYTRNIIYDATQPQTSVSSTRTKDCPVRKKTSHLLAMPTPPTFHTWRRNRDGGRRW